MVEDSSFRTNIDDAEASTPLLAGENGFTPPLLLKRIVTTIALVIALTGTSLLVSISTRNGGQIYSFVMSKFTL
jgi:hypothetical protein